MLIFKSRYICTSWYLCFQQGHEHQKFLRQSSRESLPRPPALLTTTHYKRLTIFSREIQTAHAVRLLPFGVLAKHAVSEGTKYTSNIDKPQEFKMIQREIINKKMFFSVLFGGVGIYELSHNNRQRFWSWFSSSSKRVSPILSPFECKSQLL